MIRFFVFCSFCNVFLSCSRFFLRLWFLFPLYPLHAFSFCIIWMYNVHPCILRNVFAIWITNKIYTVVKLVKRLMCCSFRFLASIINHGIYILQAHTRLRSKVQQHNTVIQYLWGVKQINAEKNTFHIMLHICLSQISINLKYNISIEKERERKRGDNIICKWKLQFSTSVCLFIYIFSCSY